MGVPSATYPLSKWMNQDFLSRTFRWSWDAKDCDGNSRKGVDIDQVAVAGIIEDEAKKAGLPAAVAAAMIVNALRETRLDPKVVGDGGHSVGLFQLHDKYHGKGMSCADRSDPRKNTRGIIAAMMDKDNYVTPKGTQSGSGAGPTPYYQTEHPMVAYARGVRDVGHLAAMFGMYVERPRYIQEIKSQRTGKLAMPDEENRYRAVNLFPSLVKLGASVPPPGSALPPLDVYDVPKPDPKPQDQGYRPPERPQYEPPPESPRHEPPPETDGWEDDGVPAGGGGGGGGGAFIAVAAGVVIVLAFLNRPGA